jgi:hypothetical protein
VKKAANGDVSINEVALNNVEPGCMKTRSSRSSEVSVEEKNLIVLASGSRARDPEESFSYFVAGRTIRAILGYNAAPTRERTRDSSVEYFDSLVISVDDVDGMRPASCSAEIYDVRVDAISVNVEKERKFCS